MFPQQHSQVSPLLRYLILLSFIFPSHICCLYASPLPCNPRGNRGPDCFHRCWEKIEEKPRSFYSSFSCCGIWEHDLLVNRCRFPRIICDLNTFHLLSFLGFLNFWCWISLSSFLTHKGYLLLCLSAFSYHPKLNFFLASSAHSQLFTTSSFISKYLFSCFCFVLFLIFTRDLLFSFQPSWSIYVYPWNFSGFLELSCLNFAKLPCLSLCRVFNLTPRMATSPSVLI